MAVRDLSASSWNAPGTAQVGLNVVASAESSSPLPLDLWLSNYAVLVDGLINLSSGFNNTGLLVNPDTTNSRFFILIPPNGNTQTITLKGVTGDTGLAQNPNGLIVLTMPSSSAPAAVGITAGGTITGCRIIWL
jgi:hypothetical protein